MKPSFGPWSTAIGTGNHQELSTFWKRRMAKLGSIRQSKRALSRRDFLALSSAGFLAAAAPTLRSKADVATPEAQAKFKGKLILFGVRGDDEKTWVIEVRREDGSNAETLSQFAEGIGFGRVSPQRDRIAFGISVKTEDETTRTDLWVMHADGGGGVLVEDANIPCWSPDGKRIAFSRGEHEKLKNLIVDVETKRIQTVALPPTDTVYD